MDPVQQTEEVTLDAVRCIIYLFFFFFFLRFSKVKLLAMILQYSKETMVLARLLKIKKRKVFCCMKFPVNN